MPERQVARSQRIRSKDTAEVRSLGPESHRLPLVKQTLCAWELALGVMILSQD